jgi:hypothetical protein
MRDGRLSDTAPDAVDAVIATLRMHTYSSPVRQPRQRGRTRGVE